MPVAGIRDRDSENIVSTAWALREQHGFAVVRSGAGRSRPLWSTADTATDAGAPPGDWLNLFGATVKRSLQAAMPR